MLRSCREPQETEPIELGVLNRTTERLLASEITEHAADEQGQHQRDHANDDFSGSVWGLDSTWRPST